MGANCCLAGYCVYLIPYQTLFYARRGFVLNHVPGSPHIHGSNDIYLDKIYLVNRGHANMFC